MEEGEEREQDEIYQEDRVEQQRHKEEERVEQRNEEEEEEHQTRRRKQRNGDNNIETVYKRPCNMRINELAEPQRWKLLYTYRNYRKYFESVRLQSIKEKLQEMFEMTPEDAELYFATLREKKPRRVDPKLIAAQNRRERKAAKAEALKVFKCIFHKAIQYAFHHAPPLLVSPMIRIVSDRMLQILCETHKVDVPKRTTAEPLPALLIAMADWVAIFVMNIYYELEVQDRKDARERKANALLECSESTSSEALLEEDETAEGEEKEKQVKLINYQEEDVNRMLSDFESIARDEIE